MTEPVFAPQVELVPHPLAPTFAADSNPNLVFQQLVTELQSPTLQTTESIRQLTREAGFVSLWFYLKFIAGFDGPYNLLNDALHVDMCNFRQKVATTPGIKAAGIIPRACYKTTIWSHGANSWELLRNPNLRIGCTSQVAARALSFVQTTIRTISQNEFHKWLYPEMVKENRSDTELILANRTRRYPEPNLAAITAGGSTQGIHVDLFDCDDIVGEDMLNADHASGADMARMVNWLYSNLRTLVVSWIDSRVMVVGTRYAIDDPYERLMQESKEHIGYWDPLLADYPLNSDGDWVTYYRPALQEDEEGNEYSINPGAFTVEQIHHMLETDPWTAQSQYINNPIAAGASDFATYVVGDVELEWDDIEHTYWIVRQEPQKDFPRVDLRECDLVVAGDPSGGATRASFSSSKAAVAVIARDSENRYYLIDAEAGFVEPTKFFDWLFMYRRKYKNYIRGTFVETQAGFKSFISIIRREETRRGEFLNFLGIPALGDKETTIRNIIQPVLNKGQLYVRKAIRGRLMEELKVFPSKKMDLLDALKIAIYKSIKPRSSESEEDEDDEEGGRKVRRLSKRDRFRAANVSRTTGY